VCRYTTLWNVRKSWFRLACQEWVRLASSSSSQEPRLTANTTVNMFSVAVYYLTSVQDASATPGPCCRTAHRHTLLGTHYLQRENVTFINPDTWLLLNSPDLNPVDYRLRCLGCPSADGLSTSTIQDNQPAKAGDRHWVGQTVAAFHWSRHWSVASPVWVSASSSSKADTLNIWCKNCMMWQLL